MTFNSPLQLLSYQEMSAFSPRTNACLLISNVDQASKRQIAFREQRESFKKVDGLFQSSHLRDQISKIKMVKKKKKGMKEENITFLAHYNKAIFLKKKKKPP